MVREWIKLFLFDTEVCVQVNGFLSDYFMVKRGCRQGDPISAYIFILCTEILNVKIRNEKKYHGNKS